MQVLQVLQGLQGVQMSASLLLLRAACRALMLAIDALRLLRAREGEHSECRECGRECASRELAGGKRRRERLLRLAHAALSYWCMRPEATSACGLKLLVYAAVSY